MAIPARLLYTIAWLFLTLLGDASASPVDLYSADTSRSLSKRGPYISTANGTISVIDPNSGNVIKQGSPSDGSGHDFSAPAIIWIVYSFAVGVPLALLGLKLLRFTSGAGLGVLLTVCMWVSFINTESASSLPDLVITLIPVGGFLIAFVFGIYQFGRLAGIGFLSLMGGYAFGVRICLFRAGLLAPEHYADWLLSTGFAMIGLIIFVWNRRVSIALSSSSVGTFLTALGVDLIINKQSGISWGLRYLFDRNAAHYQYLTYVGWRPPLVTIILLAVSLGLTPVLAFAQLWIFRPRPELTSVPSDDEPPSTESAPREESPPRKESPPREKPLEVPQVQITPAPSNESLPSRYSENQSVPP